eukprot:6100614-Pyramimonas_sp.AAC.1
MSGQAGAATISLQAKDKLRGTAFPKGDGAVQGRVQGRAFTTHGVPLLQATFNTEEAPNFMDFFRCLGIVHDSAIRDRSLRHRVVALRSDYAPGIEAESCVPEVSTCERPVPFRQARKLEDDSKRNSCEEDKASQACWPDGHLRAHQP